MQIQVGTCTVTRDSTTVVAAEGVDWTDAQIALLAGTPVYFSLIGSLEIPRQVTNVIPPGSSPSAFWELTLAAPWDEDGALDVPYSIHKDFTPRLGLPLMSPGDVQTAQLLSRMALILDTLGGASFTGGYVARTISVSAIIPAGASYLIIQYFFIPAGVVLLLQAGSTMRIMS